MTVIVWVRHAAIDPIPVRGLLDQALVVAAAAYGAIQLGMGAVAQGKRWRAAGGSKPGALPHGVAAQEPSDWESTAVARRLWGWRACGGVVIGALVLAQSLAHVDERAPYLYMTIPPFPVGVGVGADGYLVWLEGHPTYAESWQFERHAAVYTGAQTALDDNMGVTDARAAYSYLAALLAAPMGYYPAFVALNALSWLAAALATWYLAAQLLGGGVPAFAAGLLTACGQGFVFMAGTPMSYTVGYAWEAVLLALAVRWRLFGWRAPTWRWLAWGCLCGAAGLFYFTHIVLVVTAWVFGLRRAPLRSLVAATVLALVVPGLWFVAGHYGVGLAFNDETAQDLARSVRHLADVARAAPLRLPAEAGNGSVRALVGGYDYVVLGLAVLGWIVASPRRREWYLAVTVCGLAPAFVLHALPATQRYGYLSYPAIYVAAVEGAAAVAQGRGRMAAALHPPAALRSHRWVERATLGALATTQLVVANADLAGVHRFALAFGAP